MLRTLKALVVTLVVGGQGGCEPPTLKEMNERYGTFGPSPTVAEFNPMGVDACSGEPEVRVPNPINLGFLGSEDGTLALESENLEDWSSPTNALGTLDGWSTTEALGFSFSGPIDEATVVGGGAYGDTSATVRVFKVRLSQEYPFPTSVRVDPNVPPSELVYGVDYDLEVNRWVESYRDPEDGCREKVREKDAVGIIPLRPLDPASTYLVGVTDGILDERGAPVESDAVYRIGQGSEPLVDAYGQSRMNFLPGLREDGVAGALESLRALINSFELALTVGHGVSGVVLSWVFTTQGVEAGLITAAGQVGSAAYQWGPALNSTGGVLSTCVLNGVDASGVGLCGAPGLPFTGIGDIYLGTLEVTDFLGSDPNQGHWRAADGGPLTRFVAEDPAVGTLRVEGRETAPFIAVLPGPGSGFEKPAEGWPVVLFGHTLGQNRTNLLVIAEALAARGLAAVAMDLPRHGIDAFTGGDPGAGQNPFFQFALGAPAVIDTPAGPAPFGLYRNLPWFSGLEEAATERHAVDLIGNVTATDPSACEGLVLDSFCEGSAEGERYTGVCRRRGEGLTCVGCDSGGADGVSDPSGAHFFNPGLMLRTRDNLRQGVTNLLELRRTLPKMQIPPEWGAWGALQSNQGVVGTPVFDDSRVTFLGHGLGASLGVLLLASDPTIQAGALVSPLGGIARAVDASPVLGEVLGAGLACMGAPKGTGPYEDFLGALQTVMEGADPLNYAARTTQPVLMQEVVGHPSRGIGGALFFTGDRVHPVEVAGAPLSGSSALGASLGLLPTSSGLRAEAGLRVRVRVSTAGHSTFLNPMMDCDAFGAAFGVGPGGEEVALGECYRIAAAAQGEMLNEVGSFLESGGTTVEVQAVRESVGGPVDVLAPASP